MLEALNEGFSQLGNILTMDVLVMTDILIIALGNVNFSKGEKGTQSLLNVNNR